MNCKEFIYTAITFGFCNSFINKIIAIAFSLIKLGLYLRIYFYLKNWNKETEDLKSLLIFQLCFEGFIIINSSLMIIFSKYLNRKHLYRIFRAFTIIIVLYLFFNILIDICSYAHIKYLQFPDLFCLNEDPIFNYTEDTYYSLNNFLIKNTKKINISLLNKDIFEYTYLTKDNSGEKIKVSDTTNFKIIFDRVNKYENIMPYQERHTLELNFPMKLEMTIIIIDILSYFLWNNIKIRHEKLIQNRGGKIYGKKIVYVGYYTGFMECNHNEQMEKIALEEIKRNPNYISDGEIGSCFSNLLEQIKILISSFGSLVTFIVLIVQRNKRNFKDNALHFPFSITLFGGDLYLYLLIFLCVNSGLDLFIIQRIELCSNHHKFINDKRINDAVDNVIKKLKKENYQGLYDIEFLVQNDTIYLNEINFRNSGNMYALIKSGILAPYILYLYFNNKKYQNNSKGKLICFVDDYNELITLKKRYISFFTFIHDFFIAKAHSTFDIFDIGVFNYTLRTIIIKKIEGKKNEKRKN